MRPFDYVAPETVDDVLALLARHGPDARVLAGGQSLVPLLNYRLAEPRVVIDINRLPLAGVRVDGGRLSLGALTRHVSIEESPEIARVCPLLTEAAPLIGNVRVRTLGTLGGSLAHADPAAEWPMAMVTLDARLALAGSQGVRRVPAREFFRGYLVTTLAAGELLTEVDIPLAETSGYAVEEYARRDGDFALVAVAVGVRLDRQGRVDDARIGLAGVGPTPLRAPTAEDRLLGQEPTPDHIACSAAAARDGLDPPSDAFASSAYRRLLAGVLTRRALSRAVARAAGSSPV